MTIKECIDNVDNIKPNQYSTKEKVQWLSFIDEIIINDVLKTHEGYDGRYDDFAGYTEDKLSETLIVASPYDRLYTAYLKMRIDGENGETARYNNSSSQFNAYMMEYRKYYNKTHLPLDMTRQNKPMPQKKPSVGLSDAEFESLKRALYAMLTEDVAKATSHERLNSIITNYLLINREVYKGKEGRPGDEGDSAYEVARKNGYNGTEAEWLESLKGKIDENTLKRLSGLIEQNGSLIASIGSTTAGMRTQINTLSSDVNGMRQQINEEAHFRGYLETNAKIKALSATPNDFAYSAESNTKWIYDSTIGWYDSGVAVPDQLTPASTSTPLMNGSASKGQEEAYARGDHRHPTDTTRASAEEVSELKTTLEASLDAILTIQNELIGGDA